MTEAWYISKCLRLIERKVNRGSSQSWTYEDFKVLQKAIFEASSINLSTHTLERLYGKIKIHKNYRPQPDTKNSLAIFLGYKDWEEFKTQCSNDTKSPGELWEPILDDNLLKQSTDHSSHPLKSKKGGRGILLLVGLFIIGVVISYVVFSGRSAGQAAPKSAAAQVNFKVENPFGSAPHTVKFNHELSGLEGNNLFITVPAFSDTIRLQKTQKFCFWPCSLPGAYTAYLVSDNKIIDQAKIFVATQGWRVGGTMQPQNEGNRWQIPKSAVASAGRLYTASNLVKEDIRRQYGFYFLSYYNIRKFNTEGDNLAFETRFRNSSKEEQAPCNDMWFKLVGTEGVLKMHFLTTGCTGFINMAFGETILDGEKDDLTPFGIDMQRWRKARLEVINKQVHIYLDDLLIYQTKYSKSVGAIVGMEIISRMNGETDYVKLYNSKKELVYEDDFGGKAGE
jgi:hypothetical protein